MGLFDGSSDTLFGKQVRQFNTREMFHRLDSRIEWEFYCHWFDRVPLLFSFLGGSGLVDGLIVPGPMFFHPDYPWMAAVDMDIDMLPGRNGLFEDDDNWIASDYAKCKVTFQALGAGDIEYGEEAIDYSFRIITIPGGLLGYGTGTSRVNLPELEAPPLVVPQATFRRALLRQPSIPISTILPLLGCVNSSPFLGAATGTLLFVGCSSTRSFSVTGNKLWSITYSMSWLSRGWNTWLVRPSPTSTNTLYNWQNITDQSGNTPYPPADLSTLGFSA